MSKKKQAAIIAILFVCVFPSIVCVLGNLRLIGWIISGEPMIIPQDCMGSSIFLSGTVLDSDEQPIESASVHARSMAGNVSASFDIEILTDANGHFSYAEAIPVFECDRIEYAVQADGFESQTIDVSVWDSFGIEFSLERTP